MQRSVKALLALGARMPKELMLFVKNMVFLDGAIASLAPDIDLFAEIESIALMFAQKHGERIVAQLGLDGDAGLGSRHERDQGGLRPGRLDADPHAPRASGPPGAGAREVRRPRVPDAGGPPQAAAGVAGGRSERRARRGARPGPPPAGPDRDPVLRAGPVGSWRGGHHQGAGRRGLGRLEGAVGRLPRLLPGRATRRDEPGHLRAALRRERRHVRPAGRRRRRGVPSAWPTASCTPRPGRVGRSATSRTCSWRRRRGAATSGGRCSWR